MLICASKLVFYKNLIVEFLEAEVKDAKFRKKEFALHQQPCPVPKSYLSNRYLLQMVRPARVLDPAQTRDEKWLTRRLKRF